MEQTFIIFKPSTITRGLVGDVMTRFQRKGLRIAGIKMMQLNEEILREHYAHLEDRDFFPDLVRSMMATPVIVAVLSGKDAVTVVRTMTGSTNCRKAAPGTIRGDFGMSGQENIIHASDSPENAEIEIKRFFKPEEIFDYTLITCRQPTLQTNFDLRQPTNNLLTNPGTVNLSDERNFSHSLCRPACQRRNFGSNISIARPSCRQS